MPGYFFAPFFVHHFSCFGLIAAILPPGRCGSDCTTVKYTLHCCAFAALEIERRTSMLRRFFIFLAAPFACQAQLCFECLGSVLASSHNRVRRQKGNLAIWALDRSIGNSFLWSPLRELLVCPWHLVDFNFGVALGTLRVHRHAKCLLVGARTANDAIPARSLYQHTHMVSDCHAGRIGR